MVFVIAKRTESEDQRNEGCEAKRLICDCN